MWKKTPREMALLKASLKGNTAAFGAIVKQYQSLVCAITFSGTCDVQISEELAQQTFISAWKNLAQLKDLSKFRAWLSSTARNITRNFLRSKKHDIIRKATSIDQIKEAGTEEFEPVRIVIEKEQQAVIWQALQQIPEIYREPLVLFYRQEHSTRQVAEELELSEEAARQRLSRGRKMLKKQVAAMVETTIERTGPSKAFTTAVIAAVTGAAIKSSAVIAGAAAATGGTTATVTTVMSGVTAKILTAAAVVTIGVVTVVTYQQITKSDKKPELPEVVTSINEQREEQNETLEEVTKKAESDDADDAYRKASQEIATGEQQKRNETFKAAQRKKNDGSQIGGKGPGLALFVISKETSEAVVGANIERKASGNDKADYTTDANGYCWIDRSEKAPDYLNIGVNKDGFVPTRLSWRQEIVNTDIPAHYTLALEPGTSIGGLIIDEDGNAIESATAYLLVPSGDEIEKVAIWDYPSKTDVNGHWQCDIMPAKLDDVWIRLTHPDYIDDNTYGATVKPSIEKLRDMTGVMVMKKGLTVTGLVLDLNGQPIKGASVAQGSDRFGSHYPSTKTDAEGRFKFVNAPPGEMILTVQAAGCAPELKEIITARDMAPLEFRLGPGKTIRGQIVNSDGKPLTGAFVSADTWRGHRSLHWRVDTDAAGRFVWKEAPEDEVFCSMGKQDYMSIRHYAMSLSEEEYVITMYSPFQISGRVVDADSNEPINRFKLIRGTVWEKSDKPYWSRRSVKAFTDGRYEVKFSEPQDGYLVRIEADGYLPGISTVLVDDQDEVVFDFALEKGMGPSGIVYLSDGQPAAGAEVIVCTVSKGVSIQNGKLSQKRDNQFVETGADGHFSFPAQTEAYLLAVLHEEGYTEITDEELASDANITIEPWGRVEGVLRIGNEAGANEGISVNFDGAFEPNRPRFWHNCRTTTDVNGHFTLDRLPPGQARVSQRVKLSSRGTGYSQAVPVEIKPGETAHVILGGMGRPVVGRVRVPPSYTGPVNWASGHNSLLLKRPEYPKPENLDQMSKEERRAWYKAWMKTEEGKAFEEKMRKEHRSYAIIIEADGTFRVEDVPAGTYQLSINLYEKPSGGRRYGFGELIGAVNYEFEVPRMEGGRNDEPLDIGMVELELQKRLKVGDLSVEFEVETLDGKKVKLSDYRGKVVLLNFWSTQNPTSRLNVPEMKKIYNDFGRNKRFVMISLLPERNLQAARKLIEDNQLQWIHGFPDESSSATIFKDYGIQRFPTKFLIGTDNKILAKNPSFEELGFLIKEAVKQ